MFWLLFFLRVINMLTEVIINTFKRMISKTNYISTFILFLILITSSLISFLILTGISIFGLGKSISLTNLESQINIFEFLSNFFGTIVLAIIFIVILFYLFLVFYSFVISKLDKKYELKDLFLGLGSAFKRGLFLFFAIILLFIICLIITIILSLLFLIPIIGYILGFIALIIFFIFSATSFILLFGNINSKKSFWKAFKDSILNPFIKIKVVLYFIVLLLIYFILAIIFGLLSLVPILGAILVFLLYPFLFIFICSIAFELTKI